MKNINYASMNSMIGVSTERKIESQQKEINIDLTNIPSQQQNMSFRYTERDHFNQSPGKNDMNMRKDSIDSIEGPMKQSFN
jgi:hypothetical protein